MTSAATTSTVPVVEAGTFTRGECPPGVLATPPSTVSCGTLEVPENRNVPDEASVVLPIAIIEPQDGAGLPDPVFYLDGGPGGDGLTLAETLSELPLARKRRVVIVGQRGTPLADPTFDCPEVEAAQAEALDVGMDETTTAAEQAALGECFDRVTAEDPDLSTYDSATAADDLEAARLALGYGEWNLYGVSYGTRLGLEVLRRHPDAVRSAVLDSVYPP
ncbi:MAG: alpha/beta hydrolase [Microthrixaceae bacterium]|nr:alpha/beta hydrolase [Microthrixaceae bacterium]